MIVHQLSHLLTIRMIFHLDHVADYADRIGFELVHVFVIIHKKSCITRTKRFSKGIHGLGVAARFTCTNEGSFVFSDTQNQRYLIKLSLGNEFLWIGWNERQTPFGVNPRYKSQREHSKTLLKNTQFLYEMHSTI